MTAATGLAMTVTGPVDPATLGVTLIHEHVLMDSLPLLAVHGYATEARRTVRRGPRRRGALEPGHPPGQLPPDGSRYGRGGTGLPRRVRRPDDRRRDPARTRTRSGGSCRGRGADRAAHRDGRRPLPRPAPRSGTRDPLPGRTSRTPSSPRRATAWRGPGSAPASSARSGRPIRHSPGNCGCCRRSRSRAGRPGWPSRSISTRGAGPASWSRTRCSTPAPHPDRIILGHLTTAHDDRPYLERLASRGTGLAFDLFGFDHSLLGAGRYPPSDADVAATVIRLVRDGLGGRLFLSQDVGVRSPAAPLRWLGLRPPASPRRPAPARRRPRPDRDRPAPRRQPAPRADRRTRRMTTDDMASDPQTTGPRPGARPALRAPLLVPRHVRGLPHQGRRPRAAHRCRVGGDPRSSRRDRGPRDRVGPAHPPPPRPVPGRRPPDRGRDEDRRPGSRGRVVRIGRGVLAAARPVRRLRRIEPVEHPGALDPGRPAAGRLRNVRVARPRLPGPADARPYPRLGHVPRRDRRPRQRVQWRRDRRARAGRCHPRPAVAVRDAGCHRRGAPFGDPAGHDRAGSAAAVARRPDR